MNTVNATSRPLKDQEANTKNTKNSTLKVDVVFRRCKIMHETTTKYKYKQTAAYIAIASTCMKHPAYPGRYTTDVFVFIPGEGVLGRCERGCANYPFLGDIPSRYMYSKQYVVTNADELKKVKDEFVSLLKEKRKLCAGFHCQA